MNAPGTAAAEPTVRGTGARALGPRAQASRRELLDALDTLLRTTPWRLLRVTEVADLAGASPAAFYQYFSDLDDAVRHLVADRRARSKRISKHLRLVAALLEFETTGMEAPR